MRNHKVEKAEKDFGDGHFGDGRSLFHLNLMLFPPVMVYLSLSGPGKILIVEGTANAICNTMRG